MLSAIRIQQQDLKGKEPTKSFPKTSKASWAAILSFRDPVWSRRNELETWPSISLERSMLRIVRVNEVDKIQSAFCF